MMKVQKMYYSIGEVSELLGVKAHVLRYWETQFPMLKPKKNKGGNRHYQMRDIELINQIKQLLYEENFTIAGARKKLRETSGNSEKRKLIIKARSETLLGEIKKDLEDILKIFPCLF